MSLPVFEGPFDLLLSLIARKKLDITEVALAQVTDEFIAFMRPRPTCHARPNSWSSPQRFST